MLKDARKVYNLTKKWLPVAESGTTQQRVV
jgi:hypothetical protein